MSLPLGIASSKSVTLRNFLDDKFIGDDINPSLGRPDTVSYRDYQKYILKEAGDAGVILGTNHREMYAVDLVKDLQEEILHVNRRVITQANRTETTLLKGALANHLRRANQDKEINMGHARTILLIIERTSSTKIAAELQPILDRFPNDSEDRLFHVLEYLDATYAPSIYDLNKLIISRITSTGRAETPAHLLKVITSLKLHKQEQMDLLVKIHPGILEVQQGNEENKEYMIEFNEEVQSFRARWNAANNHARLHMHTPVLVFPFPVPSADGQIAVYQFRLEGFIEKVKANKNGNIGEYIYNQRHNIAQEPKERTILCDPTVHPLPNMEMLQLLLARTESNSNSGLSEYRTLIKKAIRLDSSFDELIEEILLSLAEDVPSENHLHQGIHAAHIALHGASASASAHSANAADVINDILDHGEGSANMAIGSGVHFSELETRIRNLEQGHGGEAKRPRVSYPCHFWGLDSATGRRSCSREVALGYCPYAHHHDPTIMTPATQRWVSSQELLVSNPGPHGPPAPIQSPIGATGSGQSLRPSL
jgi:hypothetical protein